MSMLNGAQYDRTASMNATGNDASYSWLTAAQNQFNSDRNYNLAQQQREDANNRYWNNFNWDQKKYRDFWDNRGNNAKEQIDGMEDDGQLTPFNWRTTRRVKTEIGSPRWFASLYGSR